MWINPETLAMFALHTEIRAAFPNVSFPGSMSNDDIASVGLVPVTLAPPPAHNPFTHRTAELPPALVDGVWTQGWELVELTPQERAARVPAEVTMRQARLALLGAGLLPAVDGAIDALPSPQREAARIEWEYSQTVQRHNGFVAALALALELSGEQIDQLFIQASQL